MSRDEQERLRDIQDAIAAIRQQEDQLLSMLILIEPDVAISRRLKVHVGRRSLAAVLEQRNRQPGARRHSSSPPSLLLAHSSR